LPPAVLEIATMKGVDLAKKKYQSALAKHRADLETAVDSQKAELVVEVIQQEGRRKPSWKSKSDEEFDKQEYNALLAMARSHLAGRSDIRKQQIVNRLASDLLGVDVRIETLAQTETKVVSIAG
jgi:hypothetical protein